MGIIKYILSTFLLICLIACQSPLSVPANRDVEIKDDPFLNPPILVSPSYINLGFVHPDSQITFSIELQNNLDKNYIVWDYNLFFNKNHFSIIDKNIPIILEPKGTDNSKAVINFAFSANKTGFYQDTLVFANLIYPIALFEATIPNFFIDNIFFQKDISSIKIAKIHNLSESNVIISQAYFLNNSKSFTILDSLPITINRNSNYDLQISYNPINNVLTEEKLIFELNGQIDKKLMDSVCKITIIK
jgi:hypothetical protein